jgi:hypothetical protein
MDECVASRISMPVTIWIPATHVIGTYASVEICKIRMANQQLLRLWIMGYTGIINEVTKEFRMCSSKMGLTGAPPSPKPTNARDANRNQ